MSAGEFDGRPLVAGSMVGVRSFRVDSYGRLTGVVKQRVFSPGDNTADCLAVHHFAHGMTLGPSHRQDVPPSWRSIPVETTTGLAVGGEIPSHRVGQLGCTCGYYAYYTDQANPNHVAGTVEAVIEGWGTVTTGSKGFRAEKARLLALVEPCRRWWVRLALYTLGSRRFMVALATVGLIVGAAGAAMLGYAPLWAALPAFVIGFLTFAGAVTWESLGFELTDEPLPWWLVVLNYPDVPVYRTRRAALRAHPLTTPLPPDPSDPSNPDFWTRDA